MPRQIFQTFPQIKHTRLQSVVKDYFKFAGAGDVVTRDVKCCFSVFSYKTYTLSESTKITQKYFNSIVS